MFGQELAAIRLGKRLPVRIQRLVPFIDDFGLIRIRGRLTNSTVVRNRFPVLLPKHHHLVGLSLIHIYSLKGAMSRFFALEKKFASNNQFKSQYVQFLSLIHISTKFEVNYGYPST